jgi:3-oxoacyl-[acyl-carrier-protein] synthase-3
MARAAVLAGVGGYLPSRLVTNEELAERLGSSDAWIRSRTGIGRRYWATTGSSTSDLAVGAGALALKSSGDAHADAVVVATTTPDRPCPGTAPTVASRLGLGGVAAYDVSAVCTGFVYGLATAAGLIATGTCTRVLVIGSETFSTILNPADRATSVIFGDGAGAVVLRAGEPDEPGALAAVDLGSDGAGADLITVRAGGSEQRLSGGTADVADGYFAMAGTEVFWRAVNRMQESVRAVLDRAGWTLADVDLLVAHQANQRILDRLADGMGLERSRVLSNIADVGNTAAASIPLALDHAHASGRLQAGDRVVLTAFGGGLTWGSATLTWPRLD